MAGVKVGCYIFQDGLSFAAIRKITLKCEQLGFDSVWLKDNFSPWLHRWFKGQMATPDAWFLESWTTLSALAAVTKKIRLGCVLVNIHRHPSLVAKMASTLSSISNGRLELGLSAGWNMEECRSYGIAFPRRSTRSEMLAEAAKVITMMWRERRPSFSGKRYHLQGALCWPKPVQRSRPALWIGGGAEETLRIAVSEAGGWVFGLCEKRRYMEALQRLREECDRVDRNWGTITRAWYGMVDVKKRRQERIAGGQAAGAITGTSDEVVREMRALLDAGVTYLVPTFPNERISEQLQVFADEVLPRLR